MGISSKKTTTKTNQNTTANITPTNPDWVTNSVQGLTGKVNDTFRKLDPYSLVAGPNELQTQAGEGAAGLATTGRGFGQAQDAYSDLAAGGNVQGQSLLDNLGSYMNPYTKDVVDTSLADYDYGAGQQNAQADLSLAGDPTFGGSGGAIYKSALGGELARGRGTLSAGLRSDAFNTGAQLSGQDADRRQAASLADLQARLAGASGLTANGMARGADDRANIDTQSQIGQILQQIQQAKAQAPVTALGLQGSLLQQQPFDLFKGTNATGSLTGTTKTKESGATLGNWLQYLQANAQAAAGAG